MQQNKSLLGIAAIEQGRALAQQIAQLPKAEAIEVLNEIRRALHEVSPFRDHPTDFVEWVPKEQVVANDYNPNVVAHPEMKLLRRSLADNGFAMPIVTCHREHSASSTEDSVEEPLTLNAGEGMGTTAVRDIVDGAHRRLAAESKEIAPLLNGYLPVATIRSGRGERSARVAATLQFNVHGEATIEGLRQVVLELSRKKWSEERIADELGMEPDKVRRLLQLSGLAELFADKEFSEAWEMVEDASGSKASGE